MADDASIGGEEEENLNDEEGEMGDMLKQNKAGFEDVIFGIMYTVTKEKYSDRNFDFISIFIDFMQLFAIIIGENFNWDFDSDHWFWVWIFRFNIQVPVVEQGYTFFIVVFYLLTFVLVGSVGMCSFVGWCFKNNSFPYVWPIKLLRFFVSLFFGVFYISSLSIFMVSVDCEIKGHDVPRLETFPNRPCFKGGQLIHLVVAIVMSIIFMVISYFMEEAQTELSPLSEDFMATPSSFVRVREFLYKTVLTIVSATLSSYPRIQGLLMMFTTMGLYYNLVRYSPYYLETCTKVRALLYAVLGWCSFCLACMAFFFENDTFYITITMFSGMLPSAVLGYMGAGWRVAWSRRLAMDVLTGEGRQAMGKNKWVDMNEVEIFSRVCRIRDDDGELIEDNVDMAEQLLKQGLAAYPNSAYLHIVYSSFLLVLRDKVRQSVSYLDAARNMDPDLGQRFQIFVREREFKQQQQGESTGEGAMDLVSYVEFQKNYRLLLHSHRSALLSTRNFWRQLMRPDLNFRHLSSAFVRMDNIESSASATYKSVLERYPKSVKLMRSYGRFLEEVKNDPWSASKYLAEADRIEDAQAEAHRESMFAGAGGGAPGEQVAVVDDQTDAVCVISILGVIQYTNKCLNKLFGYKKEELMGKNVSSLMPSPFSQNHNTYLRSYATSGKAKILNVTQSVVALHRNHYVFPVDLLVSKVEHGGTEAFMGVIKAVDEDTTVALLYVTWGGTIMCGNNIFSNAMGYAPMELVGKSVKVVGDDPHELERIVVGAGNMPADELEEASYRCLLTHKFGIKVATTLTMQFGGTKDQRILILKIKLDAPDRGMMVSTRHGTMVFANDAFAGMVGHPTPDLCSGARNTSTLIPTRFSAFHGRWMSKYREAGFPLSAKGCTAGRIVPMRTRTGMEVHMNIQVSSHQASTGGEQSTGGPKLWVVQSTRVPPEKTHADFSVTISIKPDGVVNSVDGSLWNAFGYSGRDLDGDNISSLVDVVDKRVGTISGVHEQGPADSPLRVQRVLRGMVEQTRRGVVGMWRAVVRPGGGSPPVPAALTLEQEGGPEGPINATLRRCDMLEGYLEIDQQMLVHGVQGDAATLLGWTPMRLQGSMITQVVPNIAPGNRMEEVMGIPPGTGGIKKNPVGPSRPVSAVHGDGSPLQVNLQVARLHSHASPDRYFCRFTGMAGDEGPEDSRANAWGLGASAFSGATSQQKPQGFGWDRYQGNSGSFRGRGSSGSEHLGAPAGGLPPLESAKGKGGDDEDDVPLPSNFKNLRGEGPAAAKGKGSPRPMGGGGGNKVHPAPAVGDGDELTIEEIMAAEKKNPPPKDDDAGSDAGSAAGSEGGASSLGGSSIGADDEGQPGMSAQDFARAKRFKKIVGLLQNQNARASMASLHTAARWVLCILFLVHVALFIFLRIVVGRLGAYVTHVDKMGYLIDSAQVLCSHASVLNIATDPTAAREAHRISALSEYDETLADTLLLAEEAERLHHGLYLGFGKTQKPGDKRIEEMFEAPNLDVAMLEDTRVPEEVVHKMGLWDLGNRFNFAVKRVAKLAGRAYVRDMYMVRENGPYVLSRTLEEGLELEADLALDFLDDVTQIIIYLMVLEAAGVILVCAGVMFHYFSKVFDERINLFSVFLAIPSQMVQQLATTTVKLDMDEEADNDEEGGGDRGPMSPGAAPGGAAGGAGGFPAPGTAAGGGGGGGAEADDLGGGGGGLGASAGGGKDGGKSGGQTLGTNHVAVLKLVLPLLGWAVIVAVFQLSSFLLLKASRNPLADLKDSLRMLFLASRMRFFAHEAVVGSTEATRVRSQEQLRETAAVLKSTYRSMFYGPVGSKGSMYRYSSVTSRMFSPSLCLHQPCFDQSHPYYDAVSNGIENAMLTYIEEAELLSYDDPADLHVNNTRLDYIWTVGYRDLHTGLYEVTNDISGAASSATSVDSALQACLLVIMGLVVFTYYNFMFKPFMRQTGAESKRVAELMSQLPNDKGVEILTDISQMQPGENIMDVARRVQRRRSSDGNNINSAAAAAMK